MGLYKTLRRFSVASWTDLRPVVRDIAAALLWQSGLIDPKHRGRDHLSIITFHRVLTETQIAEYPIPQIAVTRDEFEWFLRYFTRHFECGPLLASLDKFQNGQASNRPLLALTFDDGQLDNYENAHPLLAEYGLGATFFSTVVGMETGQTLWHDQVAFAMRALLMKAPETARELLTEVGLSDIDTEWAPMQSAERLKERNRDKRQAFIDKVQEALGGDGRPAWDGMMTAAQLAELAAAGHEIGSHSENHAILIHCDRTELEREVVGSRYRLEAAVGVPVETFCYPNGDNDQTVIDTVRAAGYRAAVTTAWGLNTQRQDVLQLLRCDIQGATARNRKGHLSDARLALRMSGIKPGL